MLTVHHLENSRSQRILWLLEELGVEYEIKHYKRNATTRLAPPELRAIHPLGKSPILTDDDVTIAESGAIVEYLVEKYDHGRLLPPKDTPERLNYTYWLHYAEGTFMPYMIIALILNKIDTAPMPFFVKPIARGITGKVRQSFLDQNITGNLDFMESTLASSPWFAGTRMSGADILMSFPVEAAAARSNLTAKYPYLTAYLKKIQDLPAYQRALSRGGPYELMR